MKYLGTVTCTQSSNSRHPYLLFVDHRISEGCYLRKNNTFYRVEKGELNGASYLLTLNKNLIVQAGVQFRVYIKEEVIVKETQEEFYINYIEKEHKYISKMIEYDLEGKHYVANSMHDKWLKLKNKR